MANEQKFVNHSVSRLTAHIVCVTKYRYTVLEGEIQIRCSTLIKQICDSEVVKILKGVISRDHVHIHNEYALSKSISDIGKRMKGRRDKMI